MSIPTSESTEPVGVDAHSVEAQDVDDRRLEMTEEYTPDVPSAEEYEAAGDNPDFTGDNTIVAIDEDDVV